MEDDNNYIKFISLLDITLHNITGRDITCETI